MQEDGVEVPARLQQFQSAHGTCRIPAHRAVYSLGPQAIEIDFHPLSETCAVGIIGNNQELHIQVLA